MQIFCPWEFSIYLMYMNTVQLMNRVSLNLKIEKSFLSFLSPLGKKDYRKKTISFAFQMSLINMQISHIM